MEFKQTERVELKREFNKDNRENIEKEIVAFLNTSGGIIYIGVDDNGTVVGVDRPDDALRWLSDIVLHGISPECNDYVALSTIDAEGKKIVEIDIIKGESFYYISRYGRSTKGCFIRVGTACHGLTEREIRLRHDKYLKLGVNITDVPVKTKKMSFENLLYRFQRRGLSVSEDRLEENWKLRIDGEYNILASLLADENDVSIKVVLFDGDDKGDDILLRNEFGYKCLIDAMEEALKYCVDIVNVTQTVIRRNGIRDDIRLFDGKAFRELWINACIHNDWIDGTPPAIYVFKNHIEIISTGGLPYNMTKEDFFGGVSKPVNESLAKLFIQLGIIEQTGHGIRDVLKVYDESIFTFLDNFIKVEIPYARPDYTDTWEHEAEMRRNGSYYDKSDIIFVDDAKGNKSDTANGKSVII
ncbi:MAG: putative DNA binding domain-containing protein, partial [Clostridia bacterium]|nr:putative DNA binding domain-containing protein [Clostridia bacterium]